MYKLFSWFYMTTVCMLTVLQYIVYASEQNTEESEDTLKLYKVCVCLSISLYTNHMCHHFYVYKILHALTLMPLLHIKSLTAKASTDRVFCFFFTWN